MTWFDDWSGVLRVLVTAALAYGALVAILRSSGKRSLAQLNQFDWVVTVALGSTLATVILSPDVPLLEGVAALGALVALQFLVTWSEVRSELVTKVVRGDPRLVLHEGRPLREAMRRERLTERDLLQALRRHGIARLEEAGAVVLETNGSLTVLERREGGVLAPVPEVDGDDAA